MLLAVFFWPQGQKTARDETPGDVEEINTKRWVYLMPFPCFTLIGVLELSPLEEPFVSAFVALIRLHVYLASMSDLASMNTVITPLLCGRPPARARGDQFVRLFFISSGLCRPRKTKTDARRPEEDTSSDRLESEIIKPRLMVLRWD